MAFFKKNQPPEQFTLSSEVRADLRQLFDMAPPDACGGRMRSADILPGVLVVNERLPPDELLQAITRCRAPMIGDGYMALSNRRLIISLQPIPGKAGLKAGPAQVTAIKLTDITEFYSQRNTATVSAPNLPEGSMTVDLLWGGEHTDRVCQQIQGAVSQKGQFGL